MQQGEPQLTQLLFGLQFLHLHLHHNVGLLEAIGGLTSLKVLRLSSTLLTCLPPSVGQLQQLKILDLNNCHQLQAFPHEFGGLQQLQQLDVVGCTSLLDLPGSLYRLMGLCIVKVRGCQHVTVAGLQDALQCKVRCC
jgi:Leucine-rich repeat (LRR) protein